MYEEMYKPCNPDEPSSVDLYTVKNVPLVVEMFEKLKEIEKEKIDNPAKDCNNNQAL